MSKLADQICSNTPELAPRLNRQEADDLIADINDDWQLDHDQQILFRQFEFKNYYQTMAFANMVAWVAHQQDHHPDMTISYRNCRVCYTTHSAKGLSINDFICAAKIDRLNPAS